MIAAAQAAEVREALLRLGGRATAEELSAEAVLPVKLVVKRLTDAAFRFAADGRYELAEGGDR